MASSDSLNKALKRAFEHAIRAAGPEFRRLSIFGSTRDPRAARRARLHQRIVASRRWKGEAE